MTDLSAFSLVRNATVGEEIGGRKVQDIWPRKRFPSYANAAAAPPKTTTTTDVQPWLKKRSGVVSIATGARSLRKHPASSPTAATAQRRRCETYGSISSSCAAHCLMECISRQPVTVTTVSHNAAYFIRHRHALSSSSSVGGVNSASQTSSLFQWLSSSKQCFEHQILHRKLCALISLAVSRHEERPNSLYSKTDKLVKVF